MKPGAKRRNGKYGERAWLNKLARMPKNRINQLGEKSHFAKLTEANVRAIRRHSIMPRRNAEKIARRYGISEGYVYQLRARKRWKHI